MSVALVCGVSGQDGAHLTKLLLDKGYRVIGTSRDAQRTSFSSLRALGLQGRIELQSMEPTDFRSVIQTLLKAEPDEIYNLSGQSSVGLSFEQPMETLESVAVGTLNLLEAMRMLKRPLRFYSACSGECFGNTPEHGANESTPFRPRSPYGVAKATAFWAVANYRAAYGLYACSGLLFNHESSLRPTRFVTRKVTEAAKRIGNGSKERLKLGNLSIKRDWGWAPEYVDAMWRMLQQNEAEDFVIATGHSRPLSDFVAAAFAAVGLDWRDHVDSDPDLLRPADIAESRGDPTRAFKRLGWQATLKMDEVVKRMVSGDGDAAPVSGPV